MTQGTESLEDVNNMTNGMPPTTAPVLKEEPSPSSLLSQEVFNNEPSATAPSFASPPQPTLSNSQPKAAPVVSFSQNGLSPQNSFSQDSNSPSAPISHPLLASALAGTSYVPSVPPSPIPCTPTTASVSKPSRLLTSPIPPLSLSSISPAPAAPSLLNSSSASLPHPSVPVRTPLPPPVLPTPPSVAPSAPPSVSKAPSEPMQAPPPITPHIPSAPLPVASPRVPALPPNPPSPALTPSAPVAPPPPQRVQVPAAAPVERKRKAVAQPSSPVTPVKKPVAVPDDDSDDEPIMNLATPSPRKPDAPRTKSATTPKVKRAASFNSETAEEQCDRLIGMLDQNIALERCGELAISISIIQELRKEVDKLAANGALSALPEHYQCSLIDTLLCPVIRRNTRLTIAHNKVQPDITDKETAELIQVSLECALVVLSVLTTPDMSPQTQSVEVIDAVVQLICSQFELNLKQGGDAVPYEEDGEDTPTLDKKKSAKAKKGPSGIRKLVISKIAPAITELFSKLQTLVLNIVLEEPTVLKLQTMGLGVLDIESVEDFVPALQMEGIAVVRSIFQRYQQFQSLCFRELDNILSKLSRIYKGRKPRRLYKLPDKIGNIQMTSALIMQLVHATAICPPSLAQLQATNQHEHSEGQDDQFNERLKVVETFLITLLEHFVDTKKDQDFRSMMQCLIDDLGTCLNHPEWPAAEALLLRIGKLLKNALRQVGVQLEAGARTASLDALGTIASYARADIVKSRERPFRLPPGLDPSIVGEAPPDDPNAQCPVCSKTQGGNQMVNCDSCFSWFHNSCLGLSDLSESNDMWYCDDCALKHQVFRQQAALKEQPAQVAPSSGKKRKKADNVPKLTEISEEEVLRQVVLNYATRVARADSAGVLARHFWLSRWCSDLAAAPQRDTYVKQWNVPPETINESLATMSLAGITRCVRQLSSLSSHSIAAEFDTMFKCVLSSLQDKSATMRKQTLKCLNAIIQVDYSVLEDENLRQSVFCLFTDATPGVRENAIEVVGSFLKECPKYIEKYFDMFVSRLYDTKVSVRSRCLKTLKDWILHSDDSALVEKTCRALAPMVFDDELSIQELVVSVFRDLWFGPVAKEEAETKELLRKRLAQIISVLRHPEQDQANEWFVEVLQVILGIKELSEIKEKKVKKVSDARSDARVTCMHFGALLKETVLAIEQKYPDSRVRVVEILPVVQCVELFCQVDPTVMTPLIVVLEHYLRLEETKEGEPENKAHAENHLQVIATVINIFLAVLPHHTVSATLRNDLEVDLPQLMWKVLDANVIHTSTQCMCTLASNVTNGFKSLNPQLERYYGYLKYKLGNWKTLEATRIPNLKRCLIVLGALAKHMPDLNRNLALPVNLDPQQKGVDVALYEMFLKYYTFTRDESTQEGKNATMSVRMSAVSALGGLFVTHVNYMRTKESKAIIKKCLALGDDKFCATMLSNFREFFMEDQRQLEAAQQKEQEEKRAKLPASRRSSSSVESSARGVAELYQDDFLKLCLNPKCATEALEVLGIIVQNALIHPTLAFPPLVALHASPDILIRHMARRIVNVVDEKFGTSVPCSAFVDGIFLAYQYFPASSVVVEKRNDDSGDRSIFHDLYDMLKKSPRRRQFLSSLVGKLCFSEDIREEVDVGLYKWICTTIALLPFDKEDEPVTVLQALDDIIPLKGEEVLSNLKKKLKDIEQLEKEMKKKKGDAPGTPDFEWVQACNRASAMALLVHLKVHLKNVYALKKSKQDAVAADSETAKAVTRTGQVERIEWTKLRLCEGGGTAAQARKMHEELREALRTHALDKDFDKAVLKRTGSSSSTDTTTPGAKRKRATTKTPKSSAKKSKKKKRSTFKLTGSEEDSEEHDEDDDDYEG